MSFYKFHLIYLEVKFRLVMTVDLGFTTPPNEREREPCYEIFYTSSSDRRLKRRKGGSVKWNKFHGINFLPFSQFTARC